MNQSVPPGRTGSGQTCSVLLNVRLYLLKGRGRGKKKKNATRPRPPPLLLIQDAKMASTRLQERVSALLLRCRAPSPPTPSRQLSALHGRAGDAPLWRRSALLAEGSAGLQSFCVAELQEFFTPLESIKVGKTQTLCCSSTLCYGKLGFVLFFTLKISF